MATPNESIAPSNHFEYVLSGGAFPKSTLVNTQPCRRIVLNADGDITVKRNSDNAAVVITAWPKGVPLPCECTEITSCSVNALVLY